MATRSISARLSATLDRLRNFQIWAPPVCFPRARSHIIDSVRPRLDCDANEDNGTFTLFQLSKLFSCFASLNRPQQSARARDSRASAPTLGAWRRYVPQLCTIKMIKVSGDNCRDKAKQNASPSSLISLARRTPLGPSFFLRQFRWPRIRISRD